MVAPFDIENPSGLERIDPRCTAKKPKAVFIKCCAFIQINLTNGGDNVGKEIEKFLHYLSAKTEKKHATMISVYIITLCMRLNAGPLITNFISLTNGPLV